ncbi:PREDICTED: piggyBac transposable element-derived protein 1-like [Diuraphis noxia]|uniref:piggyBac transposable element-derived protein 1-like n=1 Tax=Diuraphis noxia TaxID=143948 RepID=UPI00076398B7|nr:PREDICTED: piggyBac transposable element-derived protein 1-like [Diuraphis noxia]
MSSMQLNESSIVDCLYEDLPSDDQSCTTVDDTDDDQDYLPPQKAIMVVEEDNEASDDTGPSDLIDKEQDHTPFSVFKLLFSDEVINLIVEQTNLYTQQRYMKTGKLYMKTTNQEIMTFLGINILMGIKRLPSYRDYWSSAPDLHTTVI